MTSRYTDLLLGYQQNNKVILLVTAITLGALLGWYVLGFLPEKHRNLGRIILGGYAIGLYLVALFGAFLAPLFATGN